MLVKQHIIVIFVEQRWQVRNDKMTREEINTMKYKVCCPMCDNKKCVRNTDLCEAEQWAKSKAESEEEK